MRWMLILLFMVATLPAAEPILDQWYVGDLGGQPAISLHQVSLAEEGGGRSSSVDLEILIHRKLGNRDVTLGIQEYQRFTEDAAGRLVTFSFDHRESGDISLATGRVSGRRVEGTLSHLGRTSGFIIDLKPGEELIGDLAAQELLKPLTDAKIVSRSLAFVANQVVVARTTASYLGREGTNDQWDLLVDVMPIPMQLHLDNARRMTGMRMALGPMVLDLRQSPGPVVLAGADLSPAGLVAAAGPTPNVTGTNRFRLPVGAQVPSDEFQLFVGTDVTIRGQAAFAPLVDRDSWLGAEANLELDDPAMKHWALTAAGSEGTDDVRAERLRLAVRSHIKHKDMTVADGTALQTFRNQRGDCTEHATLLCAALRIAGIPARIEVGVVYAPGFGGWVGHAWTSAFAEGRWRHLDAAYPGIDRCRYIALGRASGNTGGGASAALVGILVGVWGKKIETLP